MRTTVTNLWCASCGTFRGTTHRPYIPRPHRTDIDRSKVCHETETFTDEAGQ